MFQWLTGRVIEPINLADIATLPVQVLVSIIIGYLIALLINPLLLMLATKILKIKNSYKKSFITILIFYAVTLGVSFITGFIRASQVTYIIEWALINFLFALWLIKSRYKLDLKKGFLIWIIWIIFSWILSYVISFILLIGGLLIITLIT